MKIDIIVITSGQESFVPHVYVQKTSMLILKVFFMTIPTVFVLYCGGEITHYKQKTMGPFCPLSCFTSKYNSPFTQSLSLSLSLSLPFSLSAFSFSCSLEDRVMHNKGTHSLTHVQCNCPTASMIFVFKIIQQTKLDF